MANTAEEVWQLLGELVTAQKETERRFQETERILKEESLKTDLRFQETERLLKEESQKTDRQIQQLSQESQKTDRQIQQLSQESQKTDRQIQQLSQEVQKTSQEVQQLSQEVQKTSQEIQQLSQEVKRGIPIHEVTQRRRKKLNGRHLEIDVLVTNENHVLVVEVKSSLGVGDVKQFIQDLN